MEGQGRLFVRQVELSVANTFVARYHRHNKPVVGHKFSLGCLDTSGLLRGIAIIGRPIARRLDDGATLEVCRVATDRCPNACSFLYGASRRVAFALGYQRVITYTLQEESGSSLRGAGWTMVGDVDPSDGRLGWLSRPGRMQQFVHGLPKWRWETRNPQSESLPGIRYPWELFECQEAVCEL